VQIWDENSPGWESLRGGCGLEVCRSGAGKIFQISAYAGQV